jgi:apolipoprotein N-acyltransferase
VSGRRAYYKRHLVPFGEFMPLRSLLAPLIEVFAIPMSDFSASSADKPNLFLAGHNAGISICYEDAFGSEVLQALPEARFLVNASNDAWFGDSLAPHQHLQIARMRALETGRFLLRATNTGVSAIIGAQGELREIAPQFEQAVLTAEIQPLQGETLYARLGNVAVLLLALVMISVGYGLGRRSS